VTAEATTIIALRIFGDSLVPDELTALLGVQPTHAHAKGDRHTGKDGREYAKRRIDMWQLRAEEFADPFEVRVLSLLARLPSSEATWTTIKENLEADLSVGYFMECTNEELLLTTKVLKALAVRGIELLLDIYDPVGGSEASTPNHSFEADGSAAAQLKR
jgi:hypothetical protein